jgi:hypothetical protein
MIQIVINRCRLPSHDLSPDIGYLTTTLIDLRNEIEMLNFRLLLFIDLTLDILQLLVLIESLPV